MVAGPTNYIASFIPEFKLEKAPINQCIVYDNLDEILNTAEEY